MTDIVTVAYEQRKPARRRVFICRGLLFTALALSSFIWPISLVVFCQFHTGRTWVSGQTAGAAGTSLYFHRSGVVVLLQIDRVQWNPGDGVAYPGQPLETSFSVALNDEGTSGVAGTPSVNLNIADFLGPQKHNISLLNVRLAQWRSETALMPYPHPPPSRAKLLQHWYQLTVPSWLLATISILAASALLLQISRLMGARRRARNGGPD